MTTPQCGQLFSDQSALIRHEKNAHGYYRRQAKEAANANANAVYAASSTASRPRRGGESVDLKFMPPLTYDPNALNPVPSEKKVQSWLKSVDGRTAGAKRSPDTMDVEGSPSPQPGYAYPHGLDQGHGHGHQQHAYVSAPDAVMASASQSDSESTVSGSASLQTASSAYHTYGGMTVAPGLYYHAQQANKSLGIQSIDCYDYMYNREDLRQHARLQGGFVASLDML